MTTIRVLLADDHDIVRAGLRALLNSLPGVEVVADADDGLQALELVGTHRPDVVVMDISMPKLGGVEAVTRITERFPGVRVIMLSMYPQYVRQALRAGAAGYLPKDAGAEELHRALVAVHAGGSYVSPMVANYAEDANGELSAFGRLSPRQREVLRLIAEGHSTAEVARELHISVLTAKTHRARLMQLLGIHDTAGLVRFAIQVGMVPAHTFRVTSDK